MEINKMRAEPAKDQLIMLHLNVNDILFAERYYRGTCFWQRTLLKYVVLFHFMLAEFCVGWTDCLPKHMEHEIC